MGYLAITGGTPDVFARAMFGDGLFRRLLLRTWPQLREQRLRRRCRAYIFGVTALAPVPMRMVERGTGRPVALLAASLLVFANRPIISGPPLGRRC